MTAREIAELESIFQAALECEPDKLCSYLVSACRGNESLQRKVQSLLASYKDATDFMETPPGALAAKVLESASDETRSMIGRTISHYRVIEYLGHGGMGEVYLLIDARAARKAVLKVLPARFTSDPGRITRFQQEARALVALNHPNIVTTYEIGEENSTYYIVTELIEGETLRQRLGRGRIASNEIVDVTVQVASALAAAHKAGVVHRDIKPDNIMLRDDGYVKVFDFGIAKVAESAFAEATADSVEPMTLGKTNVGSILGTVRYMSPEQARGEPVDHRTDIWSLGVVLYEMATGLVPFAGRKVHDIIESIEHRSPPLETLRNAPHDLRQVIVKALEKDRANRFPDMNEMLVRLKHLQRQTEIQGERSGGWWHSSPSTARLGVGAALLVTTIAVLLLLARFHDTHKSSPLAPKGIAVLPFENLSNDKEDAVFADGVQDDLLTKLATIHDLKVISRTSVMEYRGKHQVREIGDTLHVSHVLEGSVRKTGAWLHINVQLIDVGSDTHTWAAQYDRDVKDLFLIQSEIAQKVAQNLHATIAPAERLAIERPPTADITAFDLYSRAKNYILAWHYSTNEKSNLLQAADVLSQAVAHDPSFFQAYCQLAWIHDQIYLYGFDHTPARVALAEAAIQAASRLRPDAAETHLAQAQNLYWGHRDYDAAIAELKTAGQSLPNDARLFELKGRIERQRHAGNQEEALGDLEHAVELDPRNFLLLIQTSFSYELLRRYPEEAAILDRALAVAPNDPETSVARAIVAFDWKADTQPWHQVIDEIRTKTPSRIPDIADNWLYCALAEHDLTAATNALAVLGEGGLRGETVTFSSHFLEGLMARMSKDDKKAQMAFTAARTEQEKTVHAHPDDAGALAVLGLIDAGLGRKEEALHEGRHAAELLPVEKDALNGPRMIGYLAMIAAWVGDKNLACEQLAIAVRYPNTPSYGQLKRFPFWDPLQGDPCFEKIVDSLAPR